MCKLQEVEKAKEKGAQKGRAADKAEDGPPEPQAEKSKDESDVESEDEDDEQLLDEEDPPARKTEVTKIETAKPVVTKAEAAKPTATKSEATKPSTLKAEATPNQGKKSEGAQNQGKKAEGTTNQPGGQSDGNGSSAGTPSPGDPVPSSGQDLGEQRSTSGSAQKSGDPSSDVPPPSQGVAGVGGGGGSGGPENSGKSNTCPDGTTSSSYLGDGAICFSKSNDDEEIIWNAQRQSMLEDHYKNEAKTLVRMQTQQQRNHPPTQSRYTSILPNKPSLHASRPPPQQIVGRPLNENPYNAPQERDADHWDGSAIFLDGRSFTNPVTSQIAMEKAYEAEQKNTLTNGEPIGMSF
ncbi:hypothetical protein BBBOND_0310000 [Babesia bigemina]|uniref:Uncharacterized protein n=1 Tax=Babesia bigemina TaxID=5866 RepID=A0A061DAS8_BABBI|nr:hypothetical protein BBBOND_0310000 [Babesia bigemina]CDR97097.1 hypothetical protein BBBOND_0310000 [Babesia bigemina]|eukprot:XP_012769283.1 hypothetical protein BBBOND_0310000 [Babesia bigemina]